MKKIYSIGFLSIFIFSFSKHIELNNTIVTQSGFISVSDSKIYYESTGSGEAIVLLHGGYMDRRMWNDQVKFFSKKYRVITCDLTGNGKTVDGDSTYLMCDAVHVLMDSLHVSKASVAGLSLGAAVATDFAIAYPQYLNKLLLVTPGLNSLDTTFVEDSTMTRYTDLIYDAARNKRDTNLAAEYFIRCWFDGPLRTPDQPDKEIRKRALAMTVEGMKKHRFLHFVKLTEPPAIKRLKNITAPTLIIVAEKDNYHILKNAEALNNGILGSKLVMIPGAAHHVNMEKPDAFNKLVLEFLGKK